MQNAIKELEKDLAAARRILISSRGALAPEAEHQVCEALLAVTRLLLFVEGPAIKTLAREIERDYFKAKAGNGAAAAQDAAPAQVYVTAQPMVETAVMVPLPVPAGQLKKLTFECKKCKAQHVQFPVSGKCTCGNGSFNTRDLDQEQHQAFCRELEAEEKKAENTPALAHTAASIIQAGPEKTGAVATVAVATAKEQGAESVKPMSGVLSVLDKKYWSCDNEKCGSDDLVHELPPPPADGAQIASKYQCLKCGHVGACMLQNAELVALRGSGQVVAFKVGYDSHKQLVAWRDAPAPSELAVKAPEPVIMPSVRVPVGPETVTIEAPQPKKGRGRPKKEVPAAKPESFPAPAADTAQAPGATDSVALIAKIAGYESPQVNQEETSKALRVQIDAWDFAKLVSEWEALTHKVFDATKQVIPPDKNGRQALEDEVITELVGLTCGVDAHE